MLKYNEVQDGELFKWDVVGKEVEGVMAGYNSMPDTGKGPGNVYEIKTKEGTVSFFAPTMLHKKLANVQMGEVVNIKLTEIAKTKVGNTLKMFFVGHLPGTKENLKAVGLEPKMEEVGDNFGFDKK